MFLHHFSWTKLGWFSTMCFSHFFQTLIFFPNRVFAHHDFQASKISSVRCVFQALSQVEKKKHLMALQKRDLKATVDVQNPGWVGFFVGDEILPIENYNKPLLGSPLTHKGFDHCSFVDKRPQVWSGGKTSLDISWNSGNCWYRYSFDIALILWISTPRCMSTTSVSLESKTHFVLSQWDLNLASPLWLRSTHWCRRGQDFDAESNGTVLS